MGRVITMRFNMKKPCKECPFIRGSATNTTLAPGRLDGIIDDIRSDMTFTCHKSLDKPQTDQEHCAGALVFLERENRPNQMMRVAERFGMYDRQKLDMNADIIDRNGE